MPKGRPLIHRLLATHADFDTRLDRLLNWSESEQSKDLTAKVQTIIATVKTDGDAALLAYTKQLDHLDADCISAVTLTEKDFQAAFNRLHSKGQEALQFAADRIREYHQHQREASWDYEDTLGNRLGQRITPLERVGVYVPGGQASYPSSVLMTLIPASVAGVEEIVIASPTPGGERNDWVYAAAYLAGAKLCYTVGGAQAIAALAYGTESIHAVDKIIGPGGAYVAEAKRQVFGKVGIDMIAGPSEVLVITDGTADPNWLALDMLSQAEHDAAAQAILIGPDAAYLDQVEQALREHLEVLPRAEIIRDSLSHRGALIEATDRVQIQRIANRIAPEHLELAVRDPDPWLDGIRHVGALFVGPQTAEVAGDYVAGPSHVLPTQGTARFSSPLGVYDFVKRSSVVALSDAGARTLMQAAAVLAEAEGLDAHAAAARARLQHPPTS